MGPCPEKEIPYAHSTCYRECGQHTRRDNSCQHAARRHCVVPEARLPLYLRNSDESYAPAMTGLCRSLPRVLVSTILPFTVSKRVVYRYRLIGQRKVSTT